MIKTKYSVIQLCSVLMLIFHLKKSVRTQTSNYVKFELLIDQNYIAILQWRQQFSVTYFPLYIHFIFHLSALHFHEK